VKGIASYGFIKPLVSPFYQDKIYHMQ